MSLTLTLNTYKKNVSIKKISLDQKKERMVTLYYLRLNIPLIHYGYLANWQQPPISLRRDPCGATVDL